MTGIELQPCGTKAAYQRHLDRDEPACDPCVAANAAYRREHYDGTRERNRAYQKAWRLAEKRLKAMFPVEWRKVLRQEMWVADQSLRIDQAQQVGDGAG